MELEAHENYQKGSYRNRCELAGSHGQFRLSVPLQGGKNEACQIQETKLSDEPWARQHWRSIQSAYGKSPFFEFYQDELQELLFSTYTSLWALNIATISWVAEQLMMTNAFSKTSNYQKHVPDTVSDLRNAWVPKTHRRQPDPTFKAASYPQVFSERQGFLPNLSILDALFCLGPECVIYLERCLKNE